MIKYIDLNKSKQYSLPFFNDEQAKSYSNIEKGWSFSNVYHLLELKNIFIALKKIKYKGIDDFSLKAINSDLPFSKTPWDSRRILEQLNALINFKLISKDYYVETEYFIEDDYTNKLSPIDIELFAKIYHNYFRFKEMHSWLLNPIQEDHESFLKQVTIVNLSKNSKPIFPFQIDNRFNDAFIYSLKDNTDIFRILNDKNTNNGGLMRFWDVYLKWGQELKFLEKFNLRNLDYELSSNSKSFSCVYYINSEKPNFNLLEFIKSEFASKRIHIPDLILRIVLKHRYKLEDIKSLILNQSLSDSNTFSLQRTSEIFLRHKEDLLFLKNNDSYISHLIIQ